MRIIALMNQKGGVGKTTTTVNLGAALAELGKRVCLIDLDPQAHLTINYGVDPKPELVSMYDVLIEDRSFLEAVHTIGKNIALVPSSIDLAAAEIELVSVIGRETLLKHKLESVEHDFDFILLDCPPSLGLLTINALAVASEVIIPMQAHFLALQGVAKLLETVQIVNKRMNPQLKVGGIVLTMFDAQTKLSNEVVAELNNFISQAAGKPLPWAAAKVFNTRIRRNIKLAECPSFGQTILQYDPLCNGALDYRNLAREIAGLPPLVVTVVAKPAVAKPAVARPAVATAKPVSTTVAPPVMPPALVAAIKASATKKPVTAPAAAQIAPAPIAAARTTATPKATAQQPAPPAAAAPKAANAQTAPTATASSAKAALISTSQPTTSPSAARPPAASPASLIQRPIATPSLSLTPPPKPAVRPIAPALTKPVVTKPPATPPTPLTTSAPVKVTVNPTIDQSKLSAANASPTSKPPATVPSKTHAPTQEVA